MSGAEVGVGVRSVVVRIEVEQAIVVVAVIVAADVQHVRARVRVHGPKITGSVCADNPRRIIPLYADLCRFW